MSKVDSLHNKAMDLAEEAFSAKKKGIQDAALALFQEALSYECKAADSLKIDQQNEPTRSILYRSAAALAQNSNQFELAERLIS